MKKNSIRTLCVLAAAAPGIAWATSYSISTVRIDLGQNTPDSAVTIQNEAERPVSIQVRPYAWSMKNAEDVLEPTKDILVGPSVVTIQPHAKQVIRAALRTTPGATEEKTYRVSFVEIPHSDPTATRQVQMTLNVTIPLFVAPVVTPPKYAPTWKASVSKDGQVTLSLVNEGATHLHLHNLTVKTTLAGVPLLSQPSAFYVLPGATRTWTFGAGKLGADTVNLSYEGDDGSVDETIAVSR